MNTDTTQIATRNFTIQHHHHHIQIKHHPHKQIQINKISSHTAHRFIIFDTPRTHTKNKIPYITHSFTNHNEQNYKIKTPYIMYSFMSLSEIKTPYIMYSFMSLSE